MPGFCSDQDGALIVKCQLVLVLVWNPRGVKMQQLALHVCQIMRYLVPSLSNHCFGMITNDLTKTLTGVHMC